MTKEEAWLVWMNAAKTTDTPIETDFEIIKKTSWWAAFSAGWDAASVNVNGWDDAYKMGVEVGKEKHWVGLTDEERFKISRDTRPYIADTMRAHEEELKRRNT